MIFLNPRTNAVSTHPQQATHVMSHDGVLYGSNGTELVRLTGDPAPMTMTTGSLDFGTIQLKSIPSAKVSANPAGEMTMTVVAEAHGKSRSLGPFKVATAAGETEREYFVRLGSRHCGNRYSLAVNAPAGAEISYIELDVSPRRRENT